MASFGDEIKVRQRAMWASGNYDEISRMLLPAAETIVEELGIGAGQQVLDVACGTGNATLPAARTGANVKGLDLTPELLAIARDRAASESLEIEFVEGDAEALPYEDGSFDRVLSVFGAMFAPDQQRTADELVRVCRGGGEIGFTAWTPEGFNGRMFTLIGSYMPPPPDGFTPPVLWGAEERVAELLRPHGLEPRFEVKAVTFEYESIESWMEFQERTLGPILMAKAALEPEGRWEEARAELLAMDEEANEVDDGSMRVSADYLLTTATLPG